MAEPAASAVLLTAAPVALMTEPVAETTAHPDSPQDAAARMTRIKDLRMLQV